MRSRTSIRRENRAIANTNARLDSIYANRDADMPALRSKLSPTQQVRSAGTVLVNGRTYTRQLPLTKLLTGNRCPVAFSIDESVRGVYAILDADDLQPSHLGSAVNPLHFIPEAQPRNRAMSQSGALTPERIAKNLRPDEILQGITAYSGPPVVNSRGEVIQGNGRAYAIKTYYNQFPSDPNGYRAAIDANNYVFGFIILNELLKKAGITRPVLVRMLDVPDREAIRLGQFTQADLEAVASTGSKSKSKARLLTKPVLRKLTSELLSTDDGDKTLTELIRDSNVLKVLVREGVLQSGDLENYTKGGTINESGVNFVSDLLLNALFSGADTNVAEVFSQSPQAVQNIVRKSALYLLRLPATKGVGREVGNAVVAYRDYVSSGSVSFANFLNQYDLQGNTPASKYSDLELKIAALFASRDTQRDTITKFRRYAELVTTQPATLIESARPGKLKSEAAKAVFGAKYRPDDALKKHVRRAATVLQGKEGQRRQGAIRHTQPLKNAPVLTQANTLRVVPELVNTGWRNTNPRRSVVLKSFPAMSLTEVQKSAVNQTDKAILKAARASAKSGQGIIISKTAYDLKAFVFNKYLLSDGPHFYVFCDGQDVYTTYFKVGESVSVPPAPITPTSDKARAQAKARLTLLKLKLQLLQL